MDEDVAVVVAADPAGMSHAGRLSQLAALERLAARVAARTLKTLAMIEVDPPLLASVEVVGDKQYVREEVACVLHIAPDTARQRLADAVDLCDGLPATVEALEAGAITVMHARVLLEHTRPLTADVRAKVEGRVLPAAGSKTVGEFRQAVKRAVLSLDNTSQADKHRAAAADRGVWVRPAEDGMAWVNIFTTAPDAACIATAVQARADRTKIANRRNTSTGTCTGADPDERTPDQRRADALADLADLAGADGTEQGRRPAVQVTLAASTAFGLDDQPGELAGYGPIPAVLARQLAADPSGSWRWVVHDNQGQVIDISTTTYKPPAALRDFVLARDRTCRHPGCARPAAAKSTT